ncbi:MAG: GAF domain-containing protein [Armatimonadota bacterium]|nr:GAF domain-containing protein [Armatimonadota bacterium]MDR7451418.1 GAF domain-containing protein [Armatimonadota bacterium]MDR7466432.1 GAF domain-containing protein [Armatimonadota bacterium]MDR7493154.1 GAF domain-containing protein [Armatimonadota bacterium]MDR7500343.1 GAF domain-containing protein [Armatimonadota bacterium]
MAAHRPGKPTRADGPVAESELVAAAEETVLRLELTALAEEDLPLGVAYKRFLDLVHRAVGFEHGTLYVTEWGSGRLVPVAVRGNRIDLAEEVRFARGRGLSAWVAQEGRPVVIPDPNEGDGRSPFPDGALRAFLALPLVQNGIVAGVLALARSARPFTAAEFGRLGRSADALGGCLGRLRRTARLQELAYQDPRTGLSNGHHFRARIEEEMQRGRQHPAEFTVVILELGGADYGAPGVSEEPSLIQRVTRRLHEAMRSCDLAAALAPGRWGILLAGVGGARAASVVERITADVRGALPREARGGLRIGATSSAGASSAEELLDRAAAAMREVG